jgi:regulator of protease activity HflC (stomatin/prohibitin superfamily)
MTMDESSRIANTDSPASSGGGASDPIGPTLARGAESDPYHQAGSEIVELIRGFVEEVGTHRREARSAAESARADRADALRIKQEAIGLRAETESEAARILDAARAEADRMREEAQAEAAEVKRVFGTVVAELERARQKLAEVTDRSGGNVGERTDENFVVIPNTPDTAPTEF